LPLRESLLSELLTLEPLLSLELLSLEALLSLELLSLEALLSLETLLLETLCLGVGGALVNDFVGVDGGLHHALGRVALSVLHDGHCTFAVDHGLNFVDDVLHNGLLNDWLILDGSTKEGRRLLHDVLLNVVDHVLVDLSVDDRLDFHYFVLPDCLLHDRRQRGLHYMRLILLAHLLLVLPLCHLGATCCAGRGGLLDGGLLLDHACLVACQALLLSGVGVLHVDRGYTSCN